MANLDLVMRIVGQDKTGPAIKSATDNVKGLAKASDGARKAADSLKGALAGLAIGAAVGTFFKKSITAASDLEQAMGALDAVFGDNTKTMEANAKAASKIGLSQSKYAQSAAVLGAQLGNLGVSQEDLAGTTDGLMTSAADMAAQFGGTTADAVDALGALFRGERDPIEKYGVSITDAGIKAEMAATGLDKTEATMSLLNKQLEKSGTVGAAAREMNTLAGSTGRMAAEMENAAAQLGSTQLPVMAKLADMVGKLAPELADALTPAFEALGTVALDALTGIEKNMPAIQEGIADFGDKLKEIGPTVERNWPQIKETFENVAGALERVGQFTQMVWDAFKALPPEVQQLLALLAVAQKTGAINVAFKVADFFKQFMNLNANVVNVNAKSTGAGAGGGAGATAGKVVGGLAAGWRAQDLFGKAGELFSGDRSITDYLQDVVFGPGGKWLLDAMNLDTVFRVVGTQMGSIRDSISTKLGEISTAFETWKTETWQKVSATFTGVRDSATTLMSETWTNVTGWFTSIKDSAATKVSEMWTSVTGWFTSTKDAIGRTLSETWTNVTTKFSEIRDQATAKARELWSNVTGWFGSVVDSIGQKLSEAWSTVSAKFTEMKDTAWNKGRDIYDTVTGWFSGLSTRAGEIFDGMVNSIGAIWNKVTDVVKSPISTMFGWINRNMIIPINNVLGKFSDSLTLNFLSIGAYADGGYVTGPGGPRDDKIPAMLSNGEFVVNAAATKANRVALEALNAGRLGFGIGGWVPDWLDNIVSNGASAAVRFFANPAIGVMERLFGGDWSPNTVIAGMRHVVGQVDNWAKREDAATTGDYKGPRGPVQRPLNSYVVTSEWMRSGADMRHFGIDLGAPMGQAIFAAANGKVVPLTTTNQAATGGYGIMATIDHGNGLKTLYAHMNSLATSVGKIVRAGQMIGTVGSTGQSTGPHLHFETWRNGRPVDPRTVLSFDSGGWLEPGNLAYNGTRKPEPIFTAAQWQTMNKAKTAESTQVVLYIDGRILHESLVRYRRTIGGAGLGLG